MASLEKVKLPNQLVAVMGDPLLQKLLQLKSTDKTKQRVENWLFAFFEDQLQNDEGSEAVLLDMLASILDFARFTKVCFEPLKGGSSTKIELDHSRCMLEIPPITSK